jgi:hypothetical protein
MKRFSCSLCDTCRAQVPEVAPHEVLVELLRRWLLERVHLTALRIDARHDVLDRALSLPARRIHRLQDERRGPAVLGVEHVLLVRSHAVPVLQQLRRVALVQLQAAGVTRSDSFSRKPLPAVRGDVLP